MSDPVDHTRRLVGGACVLGALAWAGVRGAAVPQETALSEEGLPFYDDAGLRPHWRHADRAHRIGRFALVNQFGQALDQSVLEGGATVVNFFFTGCVSRCPVAMEMLSLAQRDMGRGAPRFLSISVTPQQDDAASLKAFARRSGLADNWLLATGRPAEVFRLARRDLLTDIETPGPDGLPPHTERALLIDAQRRIRGIYNATQASELMRMKYDVRRLDGAS